MYNVHMYNLKLECQMDNEDRIQRENHARESVHRQYR